MTTARESRSYVDGFIDMAGNPNADPLEPFETQEMNVEVTDLGGVVPPLDTLISPTKIQQMIALAQGMGRYYDATAGRSIPADKSGLCVIRVADGTTVGLGNSAGINMSAGPNEVPQESDKPGILIILGGPHVRIDVQGNTNFYGVFYTDGQLDYAPGNPCFYGMSIFKSYMDMRGTADFKYDDTCDHQADGPLDALGDARAEHVAGDTAEVGLRADETAEGREAGRASRPFRVQVAGTWGRKRPRAASVSPLTGGPRDRRLGEPVRAGGRDRRILGRARAISSGVEHLPYKQGVAGSNPASPTIRTHARSQHLNLGRPPRRHPGDGVDERSPAMRTIRASRVRSRTTTARSLRARSVLMAATALLALALAAVAAGCGGSGGSSPSLEGTAWKLTGWSISSQDPNDFTITAQFADGRIGGTSAVNTYGGPYTTGDDGAFSVGDLVSTMMAGPEPDMQAETDYMTLLAAAKTVRGRRRDAHAPGRRRRTSR